MKQRKAIVAALVLASASLVATSSSATDGYFQHGYGLIAKGMGGASTATASDTFGGATNPAKMVFVGDRLDLGIDFFSPRRSASRSGSSAALGPLDGSADSNSTLFEVPEFGYNKLIDPRLALGVSVYGNGGMNTNYAGDQIPAASACAGFNPTPGPYNLLCGNGRLGVDLIQLVIAPTVSYKLSDNERFSQAIGISPLIGFQRFRITGLQAFAGFSNSPSNLTNRGYDTGNGFGARIGWFGKFTDAISAGAAYSTKIAMSKFDNYKGLFAEEGGFDMPENYNAGMAFKVAPTVSVAVDYQRINYSKVKSVGNPSSNLLNCLGGDTNSCLGGSNGAGFGWHDINVWKLGVEYRRSDRLTLRGGYNHSDNPIRSQDVTINILAPGVIQNHLTLGLTYLTQSKGELTLAYMHAFKNSVTGSSFFNNFPLGPGNTAGSEKIEMYENAIGIAYGWKM
jgi:long-chain fatty acid transport protein